MRNIIFILISLVPYVLVSQNLVSNGSFEEFITCPENYSQHYYEPYVKHWDSPNAGTPDYFNACSEKCGVPNNWVGNSEAYQGRAYMGIIGCMQQFDRNQIAYREYLRIKLNDTLKAGQTYYASMQVRLGLSCSISCNGIGMYFSNQKLSTNRKINYPFVPQVAYNEIVDDKNNWTKVCGTFQAIGNETYLIIGNFLSNQKMEYEQLDENLIQTQHTTPSAYYFIDDVEVLPFHDSLNLNCPTNEPEIAKQFEGKISKNDKLILKNLHFEINKSIILEESYHELNQLALELKRNTMLKIHIFGHTDNTGGDKYNLELSEKRALAVRNYLLQKGISKFRMSIRGFGDTVPISDNKTEEGKKLNRRVEIEVY